MSKLRLRISTSLDGCVAGPNRSVEPPVGIGGMRLHEWAFPLVRWRALHGLRTAPSARTPSRQNGGRTVDLGSDSAGAQAPQPLFSYLNDSLTFAR